MKMLQKSPNCQDPKSVARILIGGGGTTNHMQLRRQKFSKEKLLRDEGFVD